MPAVISKPKSQLEWNEIDKSRDDQLAAAVDAATLSIGQMKRDFKWFDRYEAALVAFERGRPSKLINLEKSLGIVWDGNAYRRETVEVHRQEDSLVAVDALVEEACREIRRKRSVSWLSWIFNFR